MPLLKEVINIDTLTPVPGNVRAMRLAGQRGVHPNHGISLSPNSRRSNGALNKSGMNFQNMTWPPSAMRRSTLVSTKISSKAETFIATSATKSNPTKTEAFQMIVEARSKEPSRLNNGLQSLINVSESEIGNLDTVIGKASGSVLVTMVERYSRFTIIAKAASRSAYDVSMAIMFRLVGHRDKLHTLTFDNGKEFSDHAVIDKILGCQSYFAHPYSSWERGLNENTNGLIRQYFPKKTDFDQVSVDEIAEVESKLNRRPRKCLDTKTPNEIFFNN